jgi:hypothetical protein
VDEPFPGGERVLVITHSANHCLLDQLGHGTPLEQLVEAEFDWRPGWAYVVPANAFSSSSDIE